jgi:hypothetical protein
MSTLAQTRPRSPTEIVDASFQFFKAHAGDLLVLCALLLVPPMLIKAITPAPYNIIFEIATNVMLLVSQGAVAVLVAAALEEDSALTAGEVLRRLGEGRVGNVIVVALMGGILMGLGLILLVIPGIIVAVWLAVSTPVAAIEGRRNSAALGRSRDLARGHFWHVALTMLLAWVIFVVLAFGATIVLTLVLAMVGLPERLVELVAGVVLVPLFPLVAVATSLLYFDLRIRREGADMFALADMLPSAPARAEAP